MRVDGAAAVPRRKGGLSRSEAAPLFCSGYDGTRLVGWAEVVAAAAGAPSAGEHAGVGHAELVKAGAAFLVPEGRYVSTWSLHEPPRGATRSSSSLCCPAPACPPLLLLSLSLSCSPVSPACARGSVVACCSGGRLFMWPAAYNMVTPVPHCTQVPSRWLFAGFPLAFRWLFAGFSLAFRWLSAGFPRAFHFTAFPLPSTVLPLPFHCSSTALPLPSLVIPLLFHCLFLWCHCSFPAFPCPSPW